MKNITVSIEDEVYRKARIFAAERGTSVSAMVREHLLEVTGQGSRRQQEVKERNRLMDQLLRRTAHFRRGTKPTREEMNDR